MTIVLRLLVAFALLQALFAGRAWAQGDRAVSVEVATSEWRSAQLEAWWRDVERQARGGVGLALPPLGVAQLPPIQGWRALELPQSVPAFAGQPQADRFQVHWLRVRIAGPQQAQALFMPRLQASSATVLVRAAGAAPGDWRVLWHQRSPAAEHWPQQLWVQIPELASDGAELVVALPVAAGGAYAVSRVWIGALDTLAPRAALQGWLTLGAPQAIAVTLAVLGLFAFTLWFKYRTERGYGLFAAAAGLWVLRSLHYFIDPPRGSMK